MANAPRPSLPLEFSGTTTELLEGVHRRVIDAAEAGPVGAWVGAAKVAMPEDVAMEASGDPLVGEALAEGRERLASRLMSSPRDPGAAVWSQVRRSILDLVAADASAAAVRAEADPSLVNSPVADLSVGPAADPAAMGRQVPAAVRTVPQVFGWKVLLVGVAASAAIGLLAVSYDSFSGESFWRDSFSRDSLRGGQSGVQPEIVIVDLGRAPDMDFAVARYGLRH